MKKLLLALLLFALPVGAVEIAPQNDGSVFIKLSVQEAAACMSEGGCALVTDAGLKRLQAQAVLTVCGQSL